MPRRLRRPAEFGLIGRHVRPLAGPGALGLLDDAAVFAPPPGHEPVAAADAMEVGARPTRADGPAAAGRRVPAGPA